MRITHARDLLDLLPNGASIPRKESVAKVANEGGYAECYHADIIPGKGQLEEHAQNGRGMLMRPGRVNQNSRVQIAGKLISGAEFRRQRRLQRRKAQRIVRVAFEAKAGRVLSDAAAAVVQENGTGLLALVLADELLGRGQHHVVRARLWWVGVVVMGGVEPTVGRAAKAVARRQSLI